MQHSLFAGRYRLLQRISASEAVEIWKAEDIKTRDIVALKFSVAAEDAFINAQLLKEYIVLNQIRHPNLLSPLYYDENKGAPYLVFPYYHEKSLRKILSIRLQFTEAEAKKMLLSLAEALLILHNHKILHRNIHPENIFVWGEQYLLGYIQWRSDAMLFQQPELTAFMAPELSHDAVDYTEKADIYALGAVACYSMFASVNPDNFKDLPPFSESLSAPFKDILVSCLSVNPHVRPSAHQIIHALKFVQYNSDAQSAANASVSDINIQPQINQFRAYEPDEQRPAKPQNVSHHKVLQSEPLVSLTNKKERVDNHVPLMLIAILAMMFFFIAAAKLIFMNKQINHQSLSDNYLINDSSQIRQEAGIDEYVELPSRQLYINFLKPDTVNYSAYNYDEPVTANTKTTPNKMISLIPHRSDNGLYGFSQKDGNIVIDAFYEDVFEFSEGFAGVRYQGKWGFIDVTGRWVVPPQFDRVGLFINEKAQVEKGGVIYYINKSGVCIENCPESGE